MEDIFQNIDMTIVELKKLLDKSSNLRRKCYYYWQIIIDII